MWGAELLGNVYASAGLSIRPKIKLGKLDIFKKFNSELVFVRRGVVQALENRHGIR